MPKLIPYTGNDNLTAQDMELIMFVIQNSTLPFKYNSQASATYQKMQRLYENVKRNEDIPALGFLKEIKEPENATKQRRK